MMLWWWTWRVKAARGGTEECGKANCRAIVRCGYHSGSRKR